MEASRDIGNDDNAGSHPHDSDNTTEVINIGAYGDIERENGDRRFPTAKKTANKAVLGKSLLEPRLLCNDSRDR